MLAHHDETALILCFVDRRCGPKNDTNWWLEKTYVVAVCESITHNDKNSTSRTLETVTTEALKKAKKAGMAKMPSHRLPHVKKVTIRISSAVVMPDAMSAAERFLSWYSSAIMAPSCPSATSPLKAGMVFFFVVEADQSAAAAQTATTTTVGQTNDRPCSSHPVLCRSCLDLYYHTAEVISRCAGSGCSVEKVGCGLVLGVVLVAVLLSLLHLINNSYVLCVSAE